MLEQWRRFLGSLSKDIISTPEGTNSCLKHLPEPHQPTTYYLCLTYNLNFRTAQVVKPRQWEIACSTQLTPRALSVTLWMKNYIRTQHSSRQHEVESALGLNCSLKEMSKVEDFLINTHQIINTHASQSHSPHHCHFKIPQEQILNVFILLLSVLNTAHRTHPLSSSALPFSALY